MTFSPYPAFLSDYDLSKAKAIRKISGLQDLQDTLPYHRAQAGLHPLGLNSNCRFSNELDSKIVQIEICCSSSYGQNADLFPLICLRTTVKQYSASSSVPHFEHPQYDSLEEGPIL